MLQLDTLRLFVDQRLTAATDDIFRCFARTIAEYEQEVIRLKQEIDRQRRRPEDRPGDRPEDRPGDRRSDVLLVFTTEEEQQLKGRSFNLHIKQEECGASGPEDTDTKFSQSPDSLVQRQRPETDLSPLSNQPDPQSAEDKQEPFSIKQEVDEGHETLETAVRAEISSQQDGVLLVSAKEEERQVSGRSFSLHIKREEGGASGPEDTEFPPSPDWLMGSKDDKGSSSFNQIQSHIEKGFLCSPTDLLMRIQPERMCRSPDHHEDSVFQSELSAEDSNDAHSEPGLQRTQDSGTRPPEDNNLLVCGSCGREFSSRRTLRKHIRRNTAQDQDQMSCSLRRQRVPFQSPAKAFSCRVCGNSFYTQGILVRHAENHCKEPENQCGACGDHLESTETLRDHLRTHKELGSTCDVCGKKCSSIRRMEIHKRVHTGEKPYRCRFCSRDFSRKESLERHLKVHSGDRPHRCGLCRRTFTRREYLFHHLKNVHPLFHQGTSRPGLSAGTEGMEQSSMMQ